MTVARMELRGQFARLHTRRALADAPLVGYPPAMRCSRSFTTLSRALVFPSPWWCATLLLLPLPACKGDEKSASLMQYIDIGEGAVLSVAGDGALSVEVGGRRVWASLGGAAWEVLVVEETVEASLGAWNITRLSEGNTGLAVVGAEASDTGAVVTLRGGDVEGTLSLSAGADAIRFSWTVQADPAVNRLRLGMPCEADSSYFGWGERYHHANARGEAFRLLVSEQGIGRDGSFWALTGDEHTTYFPMPWYLDARGFGVLFHTDSRVEVDLCATDAGRATVEVMSPDNMSWTVFTGPTPVDVLRQLGDEVGRPALPPSWAYRLWVCAQGGTDAVRELVGWLGANDIDTGVLWLQDWTGQRANPGGGYGVQYRWVADEAHYPDIAAFIEELHDQDFKVIGYVNPFVDPTLDHGEAMEAGGMLPLDPVSGEVYTFLGPRGQMTMADLSQPATVAYIEGFLESAVVDVGLDGWMADFAEWMPLDADVEASWNPEDLHNRSPELWQGITRRLMERLRPDGDWLMIGRSGWTGVQSAAQIHWAGDQEADWLPTDGLPTVVPALLTMGLSGQPFVTHDIAGFSGGPSTSELYLRWTELGALTPYMRTHDGNERDENWRFDRDETTTDHFRKMVRLHGALAPTFEALAAEAHAGGPPILRHLMLQNPEDQETWAIDDQMLIGADLLAAPVLTEGAATRSLYLPEGQWVHVWTGATYSGPGTVTVDAPLGQPPLFSRDVDRPDLREAVE